MGGKSIFDGAQAHELVRSLFAESNAALVLVDLLDLRIVEANRAAADLTHRSRADLLNRRLPELFHDADRSLAALASEIRRGEETGARLLLTLLCDGRLTDCGGAV